VKQLSAGLRRSRNRRTPTARSPESSFGTLAGPKPIVRPLPIHRPLAQEWSQGRERSQWSASRRRGPRAPRSAGNVNLKASQTDRTSSRKPVPFTSWTGTLADPDHQPVPPIVSRSPGRRCFSMPLSACHVPEVIVRTEAGTSFGNHGAHASTTETERGGARERPRELPALPLAWKPTEFRRSVSW
jgi:hypothetical protein